MDKWPEDRIAIWCGYYCPPGIPGRQVPCVGCGEMVWVSPGTMPRLDKFLKEHPTVKGYDPCCPQCAEKFFGKLKKEDITIIENPNIQIPELN